jgi:serine/threonine-protein kinase
LVEIAAGGMATVFLAQAMDGTDDAPFVAIKRPHKHLASDKTYLSMLIDEARLASAIDHGNVVKVRELGFEGGEPFIVLDYVEGSSLAELRKELAAAGRAIDPRVAVRIALDALQGLHAAHILHDEQGRHLGIVHRDVSPHNVLIGCDGRSRLTDFGIAKASDRVQVTRTHEVKGKLAYLAPERVDRRRICTVQSDVFSMAVVLWECIAGRRLFRGEEAIDTLQEVLTAPIPRLRRIGAPIPQPLDDAIARGLERELDDRYKTAAEFADALERAAGRGGIATSEDVGRVIETVFGARLRVRHEQIRDAMRGRDADHVIEVSGLHPRPPPTDEMRQAASLDEIAPPAPSARYTFGNASDGDQIPRRAPWTLVIGLAAVLGVAVLGIGIAVLVRKLSRPPAPVLAVQRAAEPTVRKVVVPLPFVATLVSFDDVTRELSPPSDVVAFEVPREAGTRHRVTATGLDGTRAEGFVREEEGVARADHPGYDLIVPTLPANPAQPAAPPSRGQPARTAKPAASTGKPAPVGTTKNGFTKLK